MTPKKARRSVDGLEKLPPEQIEMYVRAKLDPGEWSLSLPIPVRVIDLNPWLTILTVINHLNDLPPEFVGRVARRCWSLVDAYGMAAGRPLRPSFRHYDWHGITGSSETAKHKMGMLIRRALSRASLLRFNIYEVKQIGRQVSEPVAVQIGLTDHVTYDDGTEYSVTSLTTGAA